MSEIKSTPTTLAEINAKYNSDDYEVLPFISKNRITPLKAGLYKKHNAKFRGVTAVYDEETGSYKYPLFGMYRVENDIVIVPESLDLSKGKNSLLEALISAGYKQVTQAPQFSTVYFANDSVEAKIALENKQKYNESKKSKAVEAE